VNRSPAQIFSSPAARALVILPKSACGVLGLLGSRSPPTPCVPFAEEFQPYTKAKAISDDGFASSSQLPGYEQDTPVEQSQSCLRRYREKGESSLTSRKRRRWHLHRLAEVRAQSRESSSLLSRTRRKTARRGWAPRTARTCRRGWYLDSQFADVLPHQCQCVRHGASKGTAMRFIKLTDWSGRVEAIPFSQQDRRAPQRQR